MGYALDLVTAEELSAMGFDEDYQPRSSWGSLGTATRLCIRKLRIAVNATILVPNSLPFKLEM